MLYTRDTCHPEMVLGSLRPSLRLMMYESRLLVLVRRSWTLINELLNFLGHLQQLASTCALELAASDWSLVFVYILLKFFAYARLTGRLRRHAI